MFLISELAIGFADAASGSAVIRRHGLSELASVYEDFDGESGVASTTLDGNGRAVRYVNEIVDVTILDSDGATVTSFTPAACATSVAVRHPMFNGATTDGRTDVGGLTTVDNVLSKLQVSLGGGVDGDVVVNGVSSSISDAIAASASSTVFNVLSYGAVGNGVTDDSAAINAAVAAAVAIGGGTVFFPPGYTYLCNTSSISITSSPIKLLGGGDASIVKSTGNSSTICTINVTSEGGAVEVDSLKFVAGTASASSNFVFNITGTLCPVRFVQCSFVNGATSGTAKTGTYAIYASGCGAGSTFTSCYVSGMRMYFYPTTNVFAVAGCSFRDAQFFNSSANVSGCRFLQTTNAQHGFFYNTASTETISVGGCAFIGNYSTTPITTAATGFNGRFYSGANRYIGCVPLDTGVSYTGAAGYVDLVRDSLVSTYISTGATDTYTPSINAGKHVIYATGASVTTVSSTGIRAIYPGARFDVLMQSTNSASNALIFSTAAFSFPASTYTCTGGASAMTLRNLRFSMAPIFPGAVGARIVLESDSGTCTMV